jgi:hypothetical protein
MIRDHDFHPPDDVRLFPMPIPGVLRLDDSMFVAVVRYGDIVLWHYAFRDHWFRINATTDLEGGLVETTAPDDVPPFAFNAEAHPFARVDAPAAPAMQPVPLHHVPLLQPGVRPWW